VVATNKPHEHLAASVHEVQTRVGRKLALMRNSGGLGQCARDASLRCDHVRLASRSCLRLLRGTMFLKPLSLAVVVSSVCCACSTNMHSALPADSSGTIVQVATAGAGAIPSQPRQGNVSSDLSPTAGATAAPLTAGIGESTPVAGSSEVAGRAAAGAGEQPSAGSAGAAGSGGRRARGSAGSSEPPADD
jgi:hypothetical protein